MDRTISAVASRKAAAGRRRCTVVAPLVGLIMALLSGAIARADGESLESSIKATYLYKLGAFVEWPGSAFQSPASPVNLCLTGKDPFGDTLDKAVDGQRIGDHPIVVRRLRAVARDSGCQILFVGGSSEQQVAEALGAVRGTAVLTVTDAPQIDDTAGIVQFVVKDNRVRFDIDDEAAQANGLTISSKLLSLAAAVRPRAMR